MVKKARQIRKYTYYLSNILLKDAYINVKLKHPNNRNSKNYQCVKLYN